mgnify:CR=1 FL=1
MWVGIIIIVLTVLQLLLSGNFMESQECKAELRKAGIEDIKLDSPTLIDDDGITPIYIANCNAIQHNVELAYYFLILGVALALGAYIIRE